MKNVARFSGQSQNRGENVIFIAKIALYEKVLVFAQKQFTFSYNMI